jgi:hypothetical protein
MPVRAGEVESQLKKSGSVKLDSNGNGVLTFDPDNANQRWEIVSVVNFTNQAATATVIPVATVAINTVTFATLSAGNNRGATWSGNQDIFRGLVDVGPCDFMTISFSPPIGATGAQIATLVGVIASAVVTGTKYTRRR